MKDWFCRTFTPWRDHASASIFIPVVLFAVAALMLIAGYAMTDDVAYAHPWYTIALAALVPAFLISLLIAQNEKQLPKDLQQK